MPVDGATGRAVGLRPTGGSRPHLDVPERRPQRARDSANGFPHGERGASGTLRPRRPVHVRGAIRQERLGGAIVSSVWHKSAGRSRRTERELSREEHRCIHNKTVETYSDRSPCLLHGIAGQQTGNQTERLGHARLACLLAAWLSPPLHRRRSRRPCSTCSTCSTCVV